MAGNGTWPASVEDCPKSCELAEQGRCRVESDVRCKCGNFSRTVSAWAVFGLYNEATRNMRPTKGPAEKPPGSVSQTADQPRSNQEALWRRKW